MSTILDERSALHGTPTGHVEEADARGRLRIALSACFYYSGIIWALHHWRRRSGPQVLILNYHGATGGDLRQHLLYLRRFYRIEHLETALEELFQGRKRGRDRRVPLVLTFDDGYHDNYTHGLPLARSLRIPMTIFLIPGYIDSGHRFWWNEAESICHFTQKTEIELEGKSYRLGPGGGASVSVTVDRCSCKVCAIGGRARAVPRGRATGAGSPCRLCPGEVALTPDLGGGA